ncbi:ubiquitin-conjugating enzyme E2 O [Cryptococcus neoformans]|nr:ubiquitin-conjugating enzyme E2 O [Cryptococcus neoformans var. grubii]OXC60397.1 ubiquitin-conjugating enzyme E2 O [Cryptococcus neoformans var. grubii MW-RSA852]
MPLPPSLPGLPDDYTPQYFGNDIVVGFDSEGQYKAKVLRCWSDEDGSMIPPPPPGQEAHPLDRPLKRGEVGISHLSTGQLAIVPESTLRLFQREFLKGDIVKRSLTSQESALVVNVKTEIKLQHALTGEELDQWVKYEDVSNALEIDARDRVVYDNWIGTVEEVFENGFVETKLGRHYRIAEMGGLLEVGRRVEEVLPKNLFEQLAAMPKPLPDFAEPQTDRVLKIDPVVVYVIWNAINQKLPPSEQGKFKEPEPFWYGEDLKKLALFDTTHSQPPSIGSTVDFVSEDARRKYGVEPSSRVEGTVLVSTMRILASRSTLVLRWQTGRETEEPSIDFVPYHNVDDYETWPGEHVMWRGDNGERRHAVVQKFDPYQRVAELLFMDDQTKELVPVMELDPGGRSGTNAYGVSIGQMVLLCEDNGSVPPEVPSFGQHETPVKNMWARHEFAKLGEEYVSGDSKFGWYPPEGDKQSVDWWGEVVQLHLNGEVTIKLANGDLKTMGIKNLAILNDPGSDMVDELGPEMNEGEAMDEDEYDEFDEWQNGMRGAHGGLMFDEAQLHGLQAMVSRLKESQQPEESESSWETMSEDDIHDVDTEGEVMEVDEMEEEEEERAVAEAEAASRRQEQSEASFVEQQSFSSVKPLSSQPLQKAEPEAGPSTAIPSSSQGAPLPKESLDEDDEQWVRFEMLEQAPRDHHFYNELSSGAAARSYHSRIQKEHRALQSSLPENILVRTYEDRLDLMRVLIIGPEGTPYTDAPFVFDVYLNPTNFPNEPPIVHFHSYTNGHGRCNPNLYEEGKVCLSILGTWSGDESESWNPSKSSLLQVFVSISGLVLVRCPYHCEPAFAKLEGTREGKINSRLYSEKAYVLSRTFVRTALERPPTGLESEIRYFYLTRGRLRSVIDHAQRLIEKGEVGQNIEQEEENAEMWNADAMGRLTMGAIITLKRTIGWLQKIWDTQSS